MMNAIEVRDLHISYKTVKPQSIKSVLLSLGKSRTDRFEAVRGVSFDVKKGEIVGLIGKTEAESLHCCALLPGFLHQILAQSIQMEIRFLFCLSEWDFKMI